MTSKANSTTASAAAWAHRAGPRPPDEVGHGSRACGDVTYQVRRQGAPGPTAARRSREVRGVAGDVHQGRLAGRRQAVGQRDLGGLVAEGEQRAPSSKVGQPSRATCCAGDDDRPSAEEVVALRMASFIASLWAWLARKLPIDMANSDRRAMTQAPPANRLARGPATGRAPPPPPAGPGTAMGMPRRSSGRPTPRAAPGVLGGQHAQGNSAKCRRPAWPRRGARVARSPGAGPAATSGKATSRPGTTLVGPATRATTAAARCDEEETGGSRRGRRTAARPHDRRQHHHQGHVDQAPAVVPGRQPGQDEAVQPPGQAGPGPMPPAVPVDAPAHDLLVHESSPTIAQRRRQRARPRPGRPRRQDHAATAATAGPRPGRRPRCGGGRRPRCRAPRPRRPPARSLDRPHRQQHGRPGQGGAEGVGDDQVAVEEQGAGQADGPDGRTGQGRSMRRARAAARAAAARVPASERSTMAGIPPMRSAPASTSG